MVKVLSLLIVTSLPTASCHTPHKRRSRHQRETCPKSRIIGNFSSSKVLNPFSELLNNGQELQWITLTLERIIDNLAHYPVRIARVIVSDDRLRKAAVAGSLEIYPYTPTRIVQRVNLDSVLMLPIAVTLFRVPSLKPHKTREGYLCS